MFKIGKQRLHVTVNIYIRQTEAATLTQFPFLSKIDRLLLGTHWHLQTHGELQNIRYN